MEAFRQNSDHHVRLAIENDGLADNTRVRTPAPRPQTVADNGKLRATRTVLIGVESAAANGGGAEDGEKIGRYVDAFDLLRFLRAAQVNAGTGKIVGGHAFESRHRMAPCIVLGDGSRAHPAIL